MKNLNGDIHRKNVNIGVFSHLKVTMQIRTVKRLCNKYFLKLEGITIKIQRNAELLSLPITGIADYNDIGRIDLTPNAFINEEELIKTILHESSHVKQLRKYGKNYVQENLLYMEQVAYRYEQFYYGLLKRRLSK